MTVAFEPDDIGPATTPTATSTGGWDLWILGALACLVAYGMVSVVSASHHFAERMFGNPFHYGQRQSVGLALGLACSLVVLAVPWSWTRSGARPVWFLSVVSLLLVHVPGLGHAAKGAPRWIDLGPINVQPSEFAKIALSLVLADALARNEGRIRERFAVIVLPCVLFVLPMLAAVYAQRDLGTIGLMLGITVVAFFVAGLELRWLLGAFGLTGLAVWAAIASVPYRAARVNSFIDPFADAQGEGYQVVQGWVALAEGGVFGEGLGHGVAQQGFLPEAHTDMISAVMVEELGVGGWLVIFLLHGILLWRGTLIAASARGLFEMLFGACITAVMAAQVLVNTAVVAGLFPPKGLVLPFMSYGASAIVAHMVMVTIILRIGLETHRARRAAGGS